ncbi:MAG: glycosyltransferase [Anaerolineae bacterium]|jgi:glycosyltransferase involved in cell wall biosynthesis|nr:glycosyltransferase [Anaerolineae bacterium]MBT7072995.1 glycosyltransferase [Anaerolineae bacterium]MBT7325275.1 glycosyltransferase [Anaerolineae bacterium]
MKISIITPSFNQADYLDETIRSVLDQGYPDLEYLIADGASTDGSVEIIEKYSEHLTWWVSEIDAGQADAINKGFSRATGEIIAWLNSDDVYLPETLSKVAALFEENPDAGIIYGDVLSIDGEGNPINVQRFSPYELEDLMAFNIISQPGVFMRRSILEQAGYLDLDYHFLLDHHLWLRMAQLAPMVYAPQILAKARYHADAKNIAHAEKFGQEAFKILAWMEQQPIPAQILRKKKAKVLAGAYHLDAFYLVEAGKMWAGLAAYARAFAKHPPTALKSWKRILYAFLSLFGFARVREIYTKKKQKKIERGL